MSRTDEVQRITENVYKSIMEQFNPCLRNFVAMGKSYEKALTREVLFQMAEVHRRIQIQLEEMLKSFHNELLTELEKKVQMDARYLNAALKKYQTEHRSKGESLEKCQTELKKLRRKSQSGKTPPKYGDKDLQQMSGAMPEAGAKTLAGPPQLAALRSAGGPQRLMEGGAEHYQQWPESEVAAVPQGKTSYSNTLPVRKAAPAKSKISLTEPRTLPRSSSMAAGLEKKQRGGRTARVRALFSHAAGDNGTLLSFQQGDAVTLLVPEARDGWHYGENEKTRMRGWFPFSYTRVISEDDPDTDGRLPVHSLHSWRSSSTGNLLDRDATSTAAAVTFADYHIHPLARQPRPYSVTMPGFSQAAADEYDPAPRFVGGTSEVKLISTV
ncbi:brain-specific angiogenesis inhibitor 1-associated protein 2 isoform X4 [Hippocampus zosterae]|uniref:brain-specific angiogenesis inhibitor 1-associated protein 2 isoform X4 n=1 Tax=Hippocampus zosterae TaxID=109293 RepID=UPI00223D8A91|nr:brain-specific angiogenesis inhibitor 1-associated protein 2 isoform X4 [Hippocampus zosterae]